MKTWVIDRKCLAGYLALPVALLLFGACGDGKKSQLLGGQAVNSGAGAGGKLSEDADRQQLALREEVNKRREAAEAEQKALSAQYEEAQETCATTYDDNVGKIQNLMAFATIQEKDGRTAFQIIPRDICTGDIKCRDIGLQSASQLQSEYKAALELAKAQRVAQKAAAAQQARQLQTGQQYAVSSAPGAVFGGRGITQNYTAMAPYQYMQNGYGPLARGLRVYHSGPQYNPQRIFTNSMNNLRQVYGGAANPYSGLSSTLFASNAVADPAPLNFCDFSIFANAYLEGARQCLNLAEYWDGKGQSDEAAKWMQKSVEFFKAAEAAVPQTLYQQVMAPLYQKHCSRYSAVLQQDGFNCGTATTREVTVTCSEGSDCSERNEINWDEWLKAIGKKYSQVPARWLTRLADSYQHGLAGIKPAQMIGYAQPAGGVTLY